MKNVFKAIGEFLVKYKFVLSIISVVLLIALGIIKDVIKNKKNNIDSEYLVEINDNQNDKIIVKISGGVNETFYGEMDKGLYLFEIINEYCHGFSNKAQIEDIKLDLVINNNYSVNIKEDETIKDNTIYIEDISTKKDYSYRYVGLINNRITIYKYDTDLSDEDFEIITKIKVVNDNLININKCSVNDLTTIKGIGQSKAQSIIDYREKNGPFQNIEDLVENKLISESVFETIKDLICVR